MSLLEDIFLRDEADEARELERIIEGDEYDEKPQQRSDSDDNSEKEDEAEEEKKRVDPSTTKTKRAVRNPRFILNPARLTGPRGIQVIPDHFKDFKFRGKGHEKEDLDLVLKKLEHWAYRLYPKFQFEDCLKKIETLGKKRPVMVHLHKIRSDQFISEETVVQKDSSDEEPPVQEEDEFDKLLQQQIEIARSTPMPGSVKKPVENSIMDRSSIMAPKATSSPSISDEQKERMLRNRKLAEERRLARLKNNSNITNNTENTISNTTPEKVNVTIDITETENINISKKQNRSNIIDSSDEEDGVTMMNESITVDIHTDTTTRNEKNHQKSFEVNRNDDFDSILIDDNVTRTDDETNKDTLNEMSEENVSEIDNVKDQNEQVQNIFIDTDSIKNTDENDSNIEHLKSDYEESMVFENENTEESRDTEISVKSNITKEKETNINNEEINSRGIPKDTNDDLMESVDEQPMVFENENTEESRDEEISVKSNITKEKETNINNEEINSKDIPKDTNDDSMDVDFNEDF